MERSVATPKWREAHVPHTKESRCCCWTCCLFYYLRIVSPLVVNDPRLVRTLMKFECGRRKPLAKYRRWYLLSRHDPSASVFYIRHVRHTPRVSACSICTTSIRVGSTMGIAGFHIFKICWAVLKMERHALRRVDDGQCCSAQESNLFHSILWWLDYIIARHYKLYIIIWYCGHECSYRLNVGSISSPT